MVKFLADNEHINRRPEPAHVSQKTVWCTRGGECAGKTDCLEDWECAGWDVEGVYQVVIARHDRCWVLVGFFVLQLIADDGAIELCGIAE